nr:MAG TPA: hypothetical protein [Caudoviricetes sp.]
MAVFLESAGGVEGAVFEIAVLGEVFEWAEGASLVDLLVGHE